MFSAPPLCCFLSAPPLGCQYRSNMLCCETISGLWLGGDDAKRVIFSVFSATYFPDVQLLTNVELNKLPFIWPQDIQTHSAEKQRFVLSHVTPSFFVISFRILNAAAASSASFFHIKHMLLVICDGFALPWTFTHECMMTEIVQPLFKDDDLSKSIRKAVQAIRKHRD